MGFRLASWPLALWASFLVLGSLAPAGPAPNGTLGLSLSRDFGYASLSGEIQGTFSLRATGPADLTRVEFFIDDQLLAEVTQPPFQLQFSTDRFPPGEHSFRATGHTAGGLELQSTVIQAEFVTASQAGKGILEAVIPILGVLLLAVVGTALLWVLAGARRSGPVAAGGERNYGLWGGAICPQCHQPFALGPFSPHLLLFRLARCPHCGRYGLVQRASVVELRQAEAMEKGVERPTLPPEESEEEKLRRELEESRYRES